MSEEQMAMSNEQIAKRIVYDALRTTGQDLEAELADIPDVPGFEAGAQTGDIVGYTEGLITIVSKQHPVAQLGIGLGTGWVCGIVGRRVGTSILFLLASGIIVLQLANHSGVVQVNWERVGDAVNTACENRLENQLGPRSLLDKLRTNRVWNALASHSYLNAGLLSGLLLGFSL